MAWEAKPVDEKLAIFINTLGITTFTLIFILHLATAFAKTSDTQE